LNQGPQRAAAVEDVIDDQDVPAGEARAPPATRKLHTVACALPLRAVTASLAPSLKATSRGSSTAAERIF
jgi:hypothetical protein